MHDLNEEFLTFSARFSQVVDQNAGRPFTFDYSGMRTLHFDGRYVQSAMRINAPNELLLSYTRAMMAFLLLRPAPRHILMIGLGGGSLAKYCYHHLPAARLTVLESDAEVIGFRDRFHVPRDDARFKIVHADAAQYVAAMDCKVDVIVHDGFDADGLAPRISGRDFYRQCRRVLENGGVLASNLLGDTDGLLLAMLDLYAVFGQAICWGDAAQCFNRIVLSRAGPGPLPSREDMLRTARGLELGGHAALALQDFVGRIRSASGMPLAEFEAQAPYDVNATFICD
jgi:spermidine synthase